MKPVQEIIDNTLNDSFTVRKFTSPCKENIFHFHAEYELTYVLNASGERYVAGKLDKFTSGDLVLIGKNTPHYYIHDTYTRNAKSAPVIVIHFSELFLGKSIYELPELNAFSKLLDKAAVGIAFSKTTSGKVKQLLLDLLNESGIERFILLFKIFQLLQSDMHYRSIGSIGYDDTLSQRDTNRINTVYSYVAMHYKEKILLKDVAKLVHLSPAAFCRFFKRLTRKSFVQYLNDYRIGKACKLLTKVDYNISEVAYICGFPNLANFNRQFKSIVHLTPAEYRNRLTLIQGTK